MVVRWCALLVFGMAPAATVVHAQQSSASAPSAEQPGEATALAPYRINPGDEIEVHVWGEERLQRRLRVLPDGSFSFPLVGRVLAASRLPSEIEAIIASGLAGQFRDTVPSVTVAVVNPAGMRFSVIGKVRASGAFSPGRYVNALEALSLAGGPTEFADLNRVVIIRRNGESLSTIPVRLEEVLRGNTRSTVLAGIPEIQGGDTLVVP